MPVLAAGPIGELDRPIDRIDERDGVERTTSATVLSPRIARSVAGPAGDPVKFARAAPKR